jgi:hypothetical protein
MGGWVSVRWAEHASALVSAQSADGQPRRRPMMNARDEHTQTPELSPGQRHDSRVKVEMQPSHPTRITMHAPCPMASPCARAIA